MKIPIVANGDIASPEKAAWVLKHTGADGVMIGRAAQGNPWIFREISHFLATGTKLAPPPVDEVRDTLLSHLENLYAFYGEHTGVRVARKHISWYSKGLIGGAVFRNAVNRVETVAEQLALTHEFFAASGRTADGRMTKDRKGPIAACVKSSMEKYFHDLNGEKVSDVYEMVLHEVEKPLLEIVMKHAKSNQCKASDILGINRNTLRKKLKLHKLDK